MKINANSIRAGNVLEYNKKLWIVSKTPNWAMPGKGGAFVQVEMKELKSKTKINERFRSNDTVEKVRLDQKDYQYLYQEEQKVILMDNETFEQLEVDSSLFGEQLALLQENMNLTVESYEDEPINIKLPELITVEILEAEPAIKNQTVSSSYKPAIANNNIKIMVPPFIESGTKVIIKSEDLSYVERAK